MFYSEESFPDHPFTHSPEELEAMYLAQAQQDWNDFLLECRILDIEPTQGYFDAYMAGMLSKLFPMDRYEYHRRRISLTALVPLEGREITHLAMEAVQLENWGLHADLTDATEAVDDLPF